jgi:hypothetical protein
MHEVFRDRDSAMVGLLDGILKESGIKTILRNWTGSNITEIPIPIMYPNICVMDDADFEEAKRIISEYKDAVPEDLPEWLCLKCGSRVDGYLSECWSCQTPHQNSD